MYRLLLIELGCYRRRGFRHNRALLDNPPTGTLRQMRTASGHP